MVVCGSDLLTWVSRAFLSQGSTFTVPRLHTVVHTLPEHLRVDMALLSGNQLAAWTRKVGHHFTTIM